MVISAQPYTVDGIDSKTRENDHNWNKLICLTLDLVFCVGFYKSFNEI